MLPRFTYHEPTSLEETVDLLVKYADTARLIAGGTDLLIGMRRKRLHPQQLISLSNLTGLAQLQVEQEQIVIGACVTHRTVEKYASMWERFTALVEGSQVVGGHQVRNVATIGGNLCNASPAADTATPLLCLNAQLYLSGPEGTRTVPLKDFFLGPGKTVKKSFEVLTQIVIPSPGPRSASTFLKIGRRRAMEISIVNVALMLTLDPDGNRCTDIRIALGAVAPTPFRAYSAEQSLRGRVVDKETILEASRLASALSYPISDVRASASYRRKLVEEMVQRGIERCLARITEKKEAL